MNKPCYLVSSPFYTCYVYPVLPSDTLKLRSCPWNSRILLRRRAQHARRAQRGKGTYHTLQQSNTVKIQTVSMAPKIVLRFCRCQQIDGGCHIPRNDNGHTHVCNLINFPQEYPSRITHGFPFFFFFFFYFFFFLLYTDIFLVFLHILASTFSSFFASTFSSFYCIQTYFLFFFTSLLLLFLLSLLLLFLLSIVYRHIACFSSHPLLPSNPLEGCLSPSADVNRLMEAVTSHEMDTLMSVI